MKTAQPYINRIIFVAFCLLTLVYSQCSYSEELQIPIRIPCSKDLITAVQAPWTIYPGIPGTQYILTTQGLLDSTRDSIMQVHKDDTYQYRYRTDDNVYMSVEARCIPQRVGIELSETDRTLECEIGEGIEVRMYRPSNIDPLRYQYAGILTIVRDDTRQSLSAIETLQKGIHNIHLSPLAAELGSR